MTLPGRNNFTLNPAFALRDLYRLFLVFAGDERIFDLAPGRQDPLRLMRSTLFADELTHLLVSTAVANRVQLDHMSVLRADPAWPGHKPVDIVCGSLCQDAASAATSVELTFREACNKIIHAMHIVPDCSDPSDNPLSSEVKLRGQLGKNAWYALLSIPQYVRASVLNFREEP